MVLVTGAKYHLGQEVVRQLITAGYDVKVIYSTKKDISSLSDFEDQLTLVHADVLDVTEIYEAMQGVKTVIHCDLIDEWTPASYHDRFKQNVEGTANVVNAMLYHQVPQLIFFSSLSVLEVEPDKTVNENSNLYENEWTEEETLSILKAEREVWRGGAEGLNISVINTAHFLNPTSEEKHLFSQALSSLSKGSVEIYDSAIYYVFLKDAVELALKVLVSDHWNKRLLAIGGVSNMEEFYSTLSNIYKYSWQPKYMNQTAVIAKAAKDYLYSVISSNHRTFRRKHGDRMLMDVKYDASHTTQLFEMEWRSVSDLESTV